MNILTFDIEDWFHVLDNLITKYPSSWDSINFLLLIVKLVNEFKIKFHLDEIAEINSFKTIHDSILKKLNKFF